MRNIIMTAAMIAASIATIAVTTPMAHAKGGGARGISISSSASSRPSTSYTTTRSSSRTTVSNSRARTPTPPPAQNHYRKDDEVECSTLRKSRNAADRQVYKRYC